MLSYEDKFRHEYPDCRLEEEIISSNLSRFHVVLGDIHFSDSGMRDFAFKYAFEDIQTGKIQVPPKVEQFELWPLRS